MSANIYGHGASRAAADNDCSSRTVGEWADYQTCHGLRNDVGQTLGLLPVMKDSEHAAPRRDASDSLLRHPSLSKHFTAEFPHNSCSERKRLTLLFSL